MPAAAVAVVAVLLIVGLYVGGIGPFNRSTSGAGAEPTFSAAAKTAESSAASVGKGPWSPILAVGIVPSANFTSTTNPSAALSSLPTSECTVTPVGLPPSTLSLSASTENLSSGGSPLWGILLRNTTGVGLISWVLNGQARPLATLSGGLCGTFLSFVQPIPSSAVDSSVAAAAAMKGGGFGFLAQHPHANLSMSIFGSIAFSSSAPTAGNWSIGLSTCPLQGSNVSSVTYSEFNAQVGVVSGKVVGTPSLTQSNNCSASSILSSGTLGGGLGGGGGTGATPLGTAMALGAFTEATKGTGPSASFWYNATVQSASGGLNWSDLMISVMNSTGNPVGTAVNATITSDAGCSLMVYNIQFGFFGPPTGPNACVPPYTTSNLPMLSGEGIDLLSSVSLGASGDSLVLTGLYPFSGTLIAAIP